MEVTECPQCGAPASPSEKNCGYCKAEFFITSLAYLGTFDSTGVNKYLQHYKRMSTAEPDSPEGFLGLGLCYLQLGMFPLAQKNFEKVFDMAPDVARAYYYYALARIKGRRLMSMPLKEIREIEDYLTTAVQLDGDFPICKLLLAMVKTDYYQTNGMRVAEPCPEVLIAEIRGKEVAKNEWDRLTECVRVGDISPFQCVTITA